MTTHAIVSERSPRNDRNASASLAGASRKRFVARRSFASRSSASAYCASAKSPIVNSGRASVGAVRAALPTALMDGARGIETTTGSTGSSSGAASSSSSSRGVARGRVRREAPRRPARARARGEEAGERAGDGARAARRPGGDDIVGVGSAPAEKCPRASRAPASHATPARPRGGCATWRRVTVLTLDCEQPPANFFRKARGRDSTERRSAASRSPSALPPSPRPTWRFVRSRARQSFAPARPPLAARRARRVRASPGVARGAAARTSAGPSSATGPTTAATPWTTPSTGTSRTRSTRSPGRCRGTASRRARRRRPRDARAESGDRRGRATTTTTASARPTRGPPRAGGRPRRGRARARTPPSRTSSPSSSRARPRGTSRSRPGEGAPRGSTTRSAPRSPCR